MTILLIFFKDFITAENVVPGFNDHLFYCSCQTSRGVLVLIIVELPLLSVKLQIATAVWHPSEEICTLRVLNYLVSSQLLRLPSQPSFSCSSHSQGAGTNHACCLCCRSRLRKHRNWPKFNVPFSHGICSLFDVSFGGCLDVLWCESLLLIS